MKKTLTAFLVLGGVASAFNDTTWTFEDELTPTVSPVSGLTCAYKPSGSASYVSTNVTVGTVFGNHCLYSDLGKAITLSDGQYIRLEGQGYWTNGSGKLQIGNNAANSFTVMAWVNFADVTGEKFFFGTGDNTNHGLAFGINGGKIDLRAKNSSSVDHYFSESITLSAGTWYNIAITYDNATGAAIAYLNGDKLGELSLQTASFADPGGTCSYIGAASQGDNALDDFSGQIAEFKILSGALTQQQILDQSHLPEPSTATLSLLALAGLMARRRRKVA